MTTWIAVMLNLLLDSRPENESHGFRGILRKLKVLWTEDTVRCLFSLPPLGVLFGVWLGNAPLHAAKRGPVLPRWEGRIEFTVFLSVFLLAIWLGEGFDPDAPPGRKRTHRWRAKPDGIQTLFGTGPDDAANIPKPTRD